MGAQAGGGGWEKGVSPCLRQCVPPDQARLAGSYSPFPKKKVLEKILHFLHPRPKPPVFTGNFRCRIGCRFWCRMQDWCRFCVFFRPFLAFSIAF